MQLILLSFLLIMMILIMIVLILILWIWLRWLHQQILNSSLIISCITTLTSRLLLAVLTTLSSSRDTITSWGGLLRLSARDTAAATASMVLRLRLQWLWLWMTAAANTRNCVIRRDSRWTLVENALISSCFGVCRGRGTSETYLLLLAVLQGGCCG